MAKPKLSLLEKFLLVGGLSLALSAKGCDVEREDAPEEDPLLINIVFVKDDPDVENDEEVKLTKGGALFALPLISGEPVIIGTGLPTEEELERWRERAKQRKIYISEEKFKNALEKGNVEFDLDDDGKSILEITPEFMNEHPELIKFLQDEYARKYPPTPGPDIQP